MISRRKIFAWLSGLIGGAVAAPALPKAQELEREAVLQYLRYSCAIVAADCPQLNPGDIVYFDETGHIGKWTVPMDDPMTLKLLADSLSQA